MADSLFVAGLDEPEADYSDGVANGIAVTVHFPLTAGTITHIRFRAPANVSAGSHQAAVWEITGPDNAPSAIRLTDVLPFGQLQPAAWNLLEIPGGLPVARGGPGGKAYRVIVYSSLGRYTARGGYFATSGKTSPGGHIHAPRNGDDPVGLGALSQGTYAYIQPGTYVAETFGASNYYVDIVFEPATTPLATGIAATIAIVDSATAAAAHARHLAAQTGLTGAAVGALTLARAGGAMLTFADAPAAGTAARRASADALILGAATGRNLAHARTLGPMLTLAGSARVAVFRAATTAETLALSAGAARNPLTFARTASVSAALTAHAQTGPLPGTQPVPHPHHVTMAVAVPGRIAFTAGPGATT